jgi:hypothetical protein
MQSAKYDHVLNLKITSEMLAAVDEALIQMRSVLRTRSDFLRAAVAYSLNSLAAECPPDPAPDEDKECVL